MAPKKGARTVVAKSPTPPTTHSKRKAPEPTIEPPVLDTLGIVFKDVEQRTAFEALQKRSIVPSRFLDSDTLDKLGLLSSVNNLFKKLGWEKFMKIRPRTYRRLTFEFLSSVKYDDEQVDGEAITFRLMNQDHKLSSSQLNDMFGWPQDGQLASYDKLPKAFNDEAFWREITGQPSYNPRVAKATRIVHPCLRYAHRVLACGLLFRGDLGGVPRADLFFLWAMTQTNRVRIDYASWLIDWFVKVSEFTKVDITCGGLITYIARHLDLDLSGLKTKRGHILLDLPHLIKMTMLERGPTEDAFYWKVNGERYMLLPNPTLASITSRLPPRHLGVRGRCPWSPLPILLMMVAR